MPGVLIVEAMAQVERLISWMPELASGLWASLLESNGVALSSGGGAGRQFGSAAKLYAKRQALRRK